MTERRPFERDLDSVRVSLDGEEAEVLRSLLDQMVMVLESIDDKDPAIRRLFPDGYDSLEDARAFRELVGEDVRQEKIAALQSLRSALGQEGPVDTLLSEDEVDAWLRAVNDLRLTLGARLEVTEETMAAEVDPKDPNAHPLTMLHWLGWLQENLLQTVNGGDEIDE